MNQEGPSQAPENTWEGYYEWIKGREPRRFFLDALEKFGAGTGEAGQRHAIDLGCGDGTETFTLLRAGWAVLAIDREPKAIELLRSKVPPQFLPRLETMTSAFEEAPLPPTNFVYAGYSLPFCKPDGFDRLWANIASCIRPDGRFAGQLFGLRDTWANNPEMTFHSAAQVAALFAGRFETELLVEREDDGNSVSGPKHWHIFDLIARKLR
jgi:SAM-dependent methyltransferase